MSLFYLAVLVVDCVRFVDWEDGFGCCCYFDCGVIYRFLLLPIVISDLFWNVLCYYVDNIIVRVRSNFYFDLYNFNLSIFIVVRPIQYY